LYTKFAISIFFQIHKYCKKSEIKNNTVVLKFMLIQRRSNKYEEMGNLGMEARGRGK
jgi:hypothetical protein